MVREPMTDQLLPREIPDGLPIGAGWVQAPESGGDPVPVRRFGGGHLTRGDVEPAHRAVESAVALRGTVGPRPSHVRRATLIGAHDSIALRHNDFEQTVWCSKRASRWSTAGSR